MMGRILAAGLLACLLPVSAASAEPAYKVPRTFYGQPDLQGAWTNASLTRLERAAAHGTRRALSEQEVAAIEGQNDAVIRLAASRTAADATVEDLPADCSDGRGADCNYNAGWTDPGNTVMRVAGEPRSSFITFPETGRVPPLTTEGQTRAQANLARRRSGSINDNPETRSLGERCILSFGNSAGPVMLPLLYNNTYEIVQTRDEIAILVEMVHDVRHIRLNATHLPKTIRPYMGDSIGWWEGETLVVETTNYHPQQSFRGASENLKVTERLTRVGDKRIHYAFKVEDPTTFSQPWGGEYEFGPSEGPVYEYACHEGNYGLTNILAGARDEEKAGRVSAPASDDGG